MEDKQTACTEIDSSTNYRHDTFEVNKIKYVIGISIYSNAIMIIVTYNGKIGNMYTLDAEEEEEINYIEEGDAPEIKMCQCILGDRRNEKTLFISNLILSSIQKKISLKNSKIKKYLLSLTLDESHSSDNKEFTINEDTKVFISALKESLNKILNI